MSAAKAAYRRYLWRFFPTMLAYVVIVLGPLVLDLNGRVLHHAVVAHVGGTVWLDTEPGDVTVHFGDAMHAAPPPTGTGPGRRALYTTWMPARAYDAIPAGRSYNDIIIRRVGG